jgi:ABC-2 type transport system permease protein
MFFAPLMLMTLVYFLLGSATTTIHVAVINGPEDYVEALYQNNVIVVRYDEGRAREALENGEVVATVNMVSGKAYIEVDGSNSAKAKMTLNTLESAKQYGMNQRADLKSEVHYIYGYEDLSDFDNFGSVLIGILIFFFVFLIAGISFLQERTSGTLEKLLSTPIRRWEVVAGYTLGYGTLTVIQSVIVSLYVVYGLDVMMVGSLWLILLITLLTAISALTLGTLLSTAANNEFQMMQFIPIVIVPQIFLSGLFELSPAWDAVGHITPLYYVADALNEVMIRGNGLPVIWLDLVVVALYCVLFMALNTVVLKRLRRI